MIITIGNTKGGVAKTTIAVNLTIARALAGRDVWLIDGDNVAKRVKHATLNRGIQHVESALVEKWVRLFGCFETGALS